MVPQNAAQSGGGYLARAVREAFPSLKNVSHDNQDLKNAIKAAARALEIRENKKEGAELDYAVDDDDDDDHMFTSSSSKRKCREPGAGRKCKAPEVRRALFEWFVDVRGCLKARLPIRLFRSKAQSLHVEWLRDQDEETRAKDDLKFTRCWIKGWCKEYNVSLLKPNKRYQISQWERILRVTELLKNVIRVRYYFDYYFKKEPTIINGDQMPLHRNESSGQKTMSMKNHSVFVKENYMLSRERCTVFTQISTEGTITPEFLFKGKGTRTKLNPPSGMHVQWAPKGSYRLPNMLSMLEKLKNRHNMFSHKNFAIYILDDYSVHLQPELKDALLRKGYILIVIGGGTTGDIQVNDTHYHHKLKQNYRDLESNMMLNKLRLAPDKVPSPSRDEMMSMLDESWKITTECIDATLALKQNFILNALDGSEDFMVRESIMSLVGNEIIQFRQELMSTPPPNSLKELIKAITAPRGVHSKQNSDSPPEDEGNELIDCEGDEIIPTDDTRIDDYESEDEEQTTSTSNSLFPAENVATHNTGISTSKSTTANLNVGDLPTVSKDEKLNADIQFINNISSTIREYQGKTSTLFLPYLSQFKDTIANAKRSLKKRIHAEQSSYLQVRLLVFFYILLKLLLSHFTNNEMTYGI